MGLDMYLEARKYVSNYNFEVERNGENAQYHSIIQAVNAGDFITDDVPSVEVKVNVMYWRKSNQIHNWFVNELAGGKDECQPIYVERENLVTLLELCKQVASQPANANKALPTSSGFFFGSTEYDEWYMQDIKRTIKGLEHILKTVPQDWSFNYQASW
jgi:hypothetical protein